ncbi:transcriptional regulator, AraC family [Renibacterium salmoninarum ATCC 33209]|uniref:Transcriptional regulator, AraC family n=1 Tax=Renibacterium salmoninarum (strain ATCC 33209 / DSM 20767 / JCM 11484 / NBRC 15589 / NCIMB 2235) TaxID=288705 RepID=A9WLN9_RENSM|nr:DJ-1/PfpI family protein [Renibacterium salmoninarum]ABY21819.1 transcriptional regulator, AraC family [Renibacterium salmoninarum ATCC 33209]
MTIIAIPVMDRVHLLDLAGPAQVFGDAAALGSDFELCFIKDGEQPISSAQGLALAPESKWPDLSVTDLILVPGGSAPEVKSASILSSASLQRLSEHGSRGGRVASVCSGAISLGLAGLLDGRRCTTHHELQQGLAARFPAANVISDVLLPRTATF